MFAAGIALGLAALAWPSFPYLVYMIATIGIIWAIVQRHDLRGPSLILLLVVGYAITVAPWMIRNGIKLNSYAISEGYAPFILAQRVAYNDMTPKELGISFLYGLPDFGDTISKKVFARDDYKRLDYAEPKGFYLWGNTVLRDRMTKEAGGKDKLLGYLIRHEILAHPVKHVLVTLSLAWRGMWVSMYWGLIAIPIFMVLAWTALRARHWTFLIYSFPAWFMLGFNAFTSVNVVRYNLTLVPCLAIAVACGIVLMVEKFKRKNRHAADR